MASKRLDTLQVECLTFPDHVLQVFFNKELRVTKFLI
ncbi:hypothetical protein T06_7272 [Trichinella sp. T6]|nr:hypothetical protein T06_7272 [Trichinella sp. T6]